MKKLIIFFTALTFFSSAQILEPVKWDFSQKQISENKIQLIFKASIDDGWYVYSQDAGDGPVSTEFTFINQGENYASLEIYKHAFSIVCSTSKFSILFKYNFNSNSYKDKH